MTATSQSGQPTVDREVGCPVLHRDFSEPQPLGCHWALADRLREQGPLYFNTYAQGYWIFTRHDAVRDIYKNRTSSRASRSRRGSRRRSIASCPPRAIPRTTSSTAGS